MSDLVLGIDSSTQSVKAVLVRATDGTVVDQAQAPHPAGTEVDPRAWWGALQRVTADLLPRAAAVAVAGQQHGCVSLSEAREPVRPALLWNDTRSAGAARALVSELGGPQQCAQAVGSVLVASFTATKLRWLRDHEPEHARATRTVLLPHDYLTWMLGCQQEFSTDAGDASGTGYYDPRSRQWRPELAEAALGHSVQLPRIAKPAEAVGRTSTGALIAPGTGDNMAAALGLDLTPGVVSVSLGTSGVAATMSATPSSDPSGEVAGFADASGNYLPLVCTLNAARILDTFAGLLAVDHDGLAELALAAEPSAIALLPYLDGERTPNRPEASGTLHGLSSGTTRAQLARAAVDGLLCSLRDAVQRLGSSPHAILLTGGAARNPAVQALAPSIFGQDITVPAPGEYVALGAARQAAWTLSGTARPPQWPRSGDQLLLQSQASDPRAAATWTRYEGLRDRTDGWGKEAN